ERAGLLQEREQGTFRRRFGDGREVSEDLVHVEDRPKARRSGLCPRPIEYLVQQEGYEEHALRLGEVRDRNDRDAGLAALRPQELPDVERDALEPRVEAGEASRLFILTASCARSFAG